MNVTATHRRTQGLRKGPLSFLELGFDLVYQGLESHGVTLAGAIVGVPLSFKIFSSF